MSLFAEKKCDTKTQPTFHLKQIVKNRINLTRTVISFRFELLNAISFTQFIVFASINTVSKALTIFIKTILPVFVLSNVL